MSRAASFLPPLATPEKLPALRIHKGKNLAYVRINGKFNYFGPPDDPETMQKYRSFCAELVASGRIPEKPGESSRITIKDLVDRFEADEYNRRGHVESYAWMAGRALLDLYGTEEAGSFGPKKLKAMIAWLSARHALQDDEGHRGTKQMTRSTINHMMVAVRRIFKWGVSEELLNTETWQALTAVSGLRAGESAAKEPRKIHPVNEKLVNSTVKHMPATLVAVIRLLQYSGARPSEVLELTPNMINRTGKIWEVRLKKHKTAHHGRERVLYFGPKAQKVIIPFLFRDGDAPLFSPIEAIHQRNKGCPTPRRDNQRPNNRRTARVLNSTYTAQDLNRAIRRVCDATGLERWTPYQLRHLAATKARAAAGLDAAQVMLGHSSADITEIYAELDATKARAIARRIG